ncbi:MAG: Gfo/Idh/MocA family protein [Planctomycetota bacterium]
MSAPIRVAILGCGMMAGAHARRLKARDDVEIVALCDTNPDAMESLSQRRLAEVTPAPQRFTDIEAMYAQAKPDAVVIVTPHTLHHAHATQALDQGCHVLLEKPMATSTKQARELVEAVDAGGKVFIICYNTSFTPAFEHLRLALTDNTYGRLEMVCGYLAQNWKTLTAGSWRQNPDLSGGGQACDSGAHLLNSLCWTMNQPVQEVFALADNQGTPVDINTALLARFADGVTANISISGNSEPDASHLAFIFDKARVEVDGWRGEWIRATTADGEVSDLPGAIDEANPDENFIEAIQGNAQPRTTARDGLIQAQLMDLIRESQRTGQPAKAP